MNNKKPFNHIPKHTSQADLNFASAAKAKLQETFSPTPKSSMDVLKAKAKTLTMTVHQHILPIVKAGGALDAKGGMMALEATMFSMFVQGFDSTMFTKEELIHLCALLHTEALSMSIEADPAGTGKPDLLSGTDLPSVL